MLGLFGSLNMASRSLSVQQQATEVAGQNLANVNNTAYSRQQLNIQTATPTPTTVGEEGNGVEAVSITQIRSAFLDNQIQAENSVTGSLTAQQSALEDAQTELGEQITTDSSTSVASSSSGLTADLSSFFNSLNGLSTDPSDLTLRQSVIQSGTTLAAQFNTVSTGLASVKAGLNDDISTDVAASNQDMSDIAGLNKQIMQAEAGGGTANDLVDLRQQKLEDLASKVGITTSTNNDGSVDVSIGTVTMVSGAAVQDTLQTVDLGNGQLMLNATNAGVTIYNAGGGSIQGDIDARDGALATLQTSVNTLASQLITQVNTIYSNGYDLNGDTQSNFFEGTSAADVSVNSYLANDPTALQVSSTAGDNGDNTIALQLAQLGNANISGLSNQTFSQSYSESVSALGNSLSSVNDQVTNSTAVAQMLATQRSSVSGVSTDEEMTNLVQFQKAYEASAELITTLNQMLETVVTMKTV